MVKLSSLYHVPAKAVSNLVENVKAAPARFGHWIAAHPTMELTKTQRLVVWFSGKMGVEHDCSYKQAFTSAKRVALTVGALATGIAASYYVGEAFSTAGSYLTGSAKSYNDPDMEIIGNHLSTIGKLTQKTSLTVGYYTVSNLHTALNYMTSLLRNAKDHLNSTIPLPC